MMAEEIIIDIQAAARANDLEMSIHALHEAYAEHIAPEQIREALLNGRILENYPEHRRGACCLFYGATEAQRPIHVVCTSHRRPVLIITVYEPKLPKWLTPTQRNNP